MKLKRYHGNPILEKNPRVSWEAGSVLNPGVLYEDGLFRMVYRATNDIKRDEEGGYMSSIGYAESTDGIHFTRFPKPIISPDQEYEKKLGCEDPRVTKIGDTYFLYYTAVGGDEDWEVRIALATSKDFKTWKKHGIIGPRHATSKAAVLFPEKINGHYIWFYTWEADSPLSSIIQVKYQDLDEVIHSPRSLIEESIESFDNHVVFSPPEGVYRGAEVGAVPIKTKDGWLFIYCNANVSDHPEWTISAALLDLKNPRKIIAHTKEPILRPETEDELEGVVDNVTFPEGAVIVGEELYVYYGSGDQGICLATCKVDELLHHLKRK